MLRNDLQLVWNRGRRIGEAQHLTENEICFSSGNFIKILNTNGQETDFQMCARGVGCVTASAQLGVIAASDRGLKPIIHMIKYPELSELKQKLSEGAVLEYLSMAFCGTDYLVTVEGEPEFSAIVWKWTTAFKIYTLPQVVRVNDPTSLRISVSAINEYDVCLQHAGGLTFMELEDMGYTANVKSRSLYFPEMGDSTCKTSVTDENAHLLSLSSHGTSHPRTWGKHSEVLYSLPVSVIVNGLSVDQTVSFRDRITKTRRMTPSCHCWLPSGELVVGCLSGQVLQVKTKDFEVSQIRDTSSDGGGTFGEVVGVALNTTGLFIGKSNGLVLKMKQKKDTWVLLEVFQLNVLVKHFQFAPDYKTLTIASTDGSLLQYNTEDNKPPCIFYEGFSQSPVVGICMIYASHCLFAREEGTVEVWNTDYATLTTKYRIDSKITSMGGSPLCSVALLGCATGQVHVIDATGPTKLRTLRVLEPFDTPVSLVRYENFGRYAVFASSFDGFFLVNGLPSSGMPVLGFGAVQNILDINIFSKDVDTATLILVLFGSDDCASGTGNMLKLYKVPEGFYKNFRECCGSGVVELGNVVECRTFALLSAVSSVVYHSVHGLLAYSCGHNKIHVYDLNEVRLKTEIATPHEMGKCSLLLSSGHDFLASFGDDGKVCVYESETLQGEAISLSSHCYRSGGVLWACFSDVKSIILTVGADGNLVCLGWHRTKSEVNPLSNPWVTHCMSVKKRLNGVISSMRKQEPLPTTAWTKTIRDNNIQSIVNLLQARKEDLQGEMKSLWRKIGEVIQMNKRLPPEYRLPTRELVLDDIVYQNMFQSRCKAVLLADYRVRTQLAQIKMDAIKLKAETFAGGYTRRRSLKSLKTGKTVSNYSMRLRSKTEKLDLQRIETKIKLHFRKKAHSTQEPDAEDQASADGDSDEPLLLDPFSLVTKEQKIDQIILMKDAIYQKKLKFNQDFEMLAELKQKQKWLLAEKIARLKFLVKALHVDGTIWEPQWDDDDDQCGDVTTTPDELHYWERAKDSGKRLHRLSSTDSKYFYSAEAIKSKLERMVKPKDEYEAELLADIPKPDFMEDVPSVHWTRSERDIAKQYNNKIEQIRVKKSRYLIKLKSELSDVQTSIEDLVKQFDAAHQDLVTDKLECDLYTHLNELTIAALMMTITIDDKLKQWVQNLALKRKLLDEETEQIDSFTRIAEHALGWSTGILQALHEKENVVKEQIRGIMPDKYTANMLLPLARKRPEVLKSLPKCELCPYEPKEVHITENQIRKALLTLDSDENRPKRVAPLLWKNLCFIRCQQVILEQRVRKHKGTVERCKKTLEKARAKWSEIGEQACAMKEQIAEVHSLRVMCILDVPQVYGAENKLLELEDSQDLNSSCVLIKRRMTDYMNKKSNESKRMYLTTVKDGSHVRNELKVRFIEFKRLNIVMQQCLRDMKTLDGIPLNKDLKMILTTDSLDPNARAEHVYKAAEHETRELEREFAHVDREQNKTEREIIREVLKIKNLERKIKVHEEELTQLKYICEVDVE